MECFEENIIQLEGSLHGVVANMLDCNIVVSEFELQFRNYVYFWTNTFGKGINLLVTLHYELSSTSTILIQGLLWH